MRHSYSSEKILHIRRCHICGHLNESDSAHVEQCSSCGKHLVSFLFCKDPGVEELTSDFRTSVDSSTDVSMDKIVSPQSTLRSEYPPIYGISLYWS